MKEFSSKYKFASGLRAYDEFGHDSPGLLQCFNMIPRRGKLKGYVPPSALMGVTMDWPFPQLFIGKKYNFLCGRTYIKTLDSNLNEIATYSTLEGTQWTFADFWNYVVFANGAEMYVTSPTTGTVGKYIGPQIPLSGVIENFKGQLIAGKVAGLAENVLLCGEIGYANLVQGTSGEVSQIPMPWQGEISLIRRIADTLVVGGSGGVTLLQVPPKTHQLSPGAFLMKETEIPGIVAGGGNIHGIVLLDETGCLWKVGSDGVPKELGYREFFTPMLAGDISISYDPRTLFHDYYISDGVDSFIYTDDGLGKIAEHVSSCAVFGSSLVGTYTAQADTSWLVETDLYDFGLRAKKSTEWTEIVNIGATTVQVLNPTIGPTTRLSAAGDGKSKVTANDFKFIIQGNSRNSAILEEMVIRYKLPDKHSIRGEYASKASTRSNS